MSNQAIKYVQYLEGELRKQRLYKRLFWGLLAIVILGNLLPGLLGFIGICLSLVAGVGLIVCIAYIVNQYPLLFLNTVGTLFLAYLPNLLNDYLGPTNFSDPVFEEIFRVICLLPFVVFALRCARNPAAYFKRTSDIS